MPKRKDPHDLVKKAYGSIAKKKSSCGCCDSKDPASTCRPQPKGQAVPEAELGLSCGNPVAFSHVRAGDVVVDLGSGAGRDVFLAAEKVGPKGRAIGIDMTPGMLRLARANARKFAERTGLENVEFRKGFIEDLPVDDASADLVISNCVINLSPDKPQVFREIHRVLRPGGRMVVSDLVLNRPLPDALKNDENVHVACIAGALLKKDYLAAVRAAGFKKVDILKEVVWRPSHSGGDPVSGASTALLDGLAASITILAVK